MLKDDKDMKILILFLIVQLNTYDGIRNSIHNLRKSGVIQKKIPVHAMKQKIFFSFFMMKLRMKISYEACRKGRTVQELLLKSILKTYKQRLDEGLIEDPYPVITKKHVADLHTMCVKGFTSQTMQDEAKQLER